jgi:hypothetical protein
MNCFSTVVMKDNVPTLHLMSKIKIGSARNSARVVITHARLVKDLGKINANLVVSMERVAKQRIVSRCWVNAFVLLIQQRLMEYAM